ncbi:MAG: hypothetical protein WAW17_08980 [Rhodococcus sp. (in: high G+C Gram-positive bacteria)]|uniref:hypothetical protein n=1 Tax=Rhodococcus sp. TaxID=1831 RepID=UPI003BB1709F
MIIRKPLVTAGALIVALSLSACVSVDTADEDAPASSAASATAAEIAAPSAETLQDTLTLLVDPARSVDEKSAAVEDGETRRPNIEAMSAAMADYPVSFTVSDVQVEGTTATAAVAAKSPHGEAAPTPWTWKYLDGAWKVSDESTCTLLGMARAACG